MTEPVIVPLSAIQKDGALQPRVEGLNEEHVLALMESIDRWTPITLVQLPNGLRLVGGTHRVEAASRLGVESIAALVIDPPPDGNLFRVAFEDNIAHGLPPTLQDRKSYARRILQEQP